MDESGHRQHHSGTRFIQNHLCSQGPRLMSTPKRTTTNIAQSFRRAMLALLHETEEPGLHSLKHVLIHGAIVVR